VVDLWHRSGVSRPWNDTHRDIERKLRVQPELFLVGTLDAGIVATAMAGYDGHRGWIYYMAVDPARQRQGIGRRMLEHVEQELRALGCPKINLQVRGDNRQAVRFYERLGFAVEDNLSLGRRL
jgi:ribosomal protein S18 acetylase RimI-like enzyme